MSEILDSIGRRRKTRERHGDGYEFVRDQRIRDRVSDRAGRSKGTAGNRIIPLTKEKSLES